MTEKDEILAVALTREECAAQIKEAVEAILNDANTYAYRDRTVPDIQGILVEKLHRLGYDAVVALEFDMVVFEFIYSVRVNGMVVEGVSSL